MGVEVEDWKWRQFVKIIEGLNPWPEFVESWTPRLGRYDQTLHFPALPHKFAGPTSLARLGRLWTSVLTEDCSPQLFLEVLNIFV